MIRFAFKQEQARLQQLFNLCFPGEEDFGAWFFSTIYAPEKTMVYEQDGTVIAMVHLLERTVHDGQQAYRASYIYAVATDPKEQGKGIMRQLLQAVFAQNHADGIDCSILITQNDSLFDYYSRFGYQTQFLAAQEQVAAKDSQISITQVADAMLGECNALYEASCKGLLHAVRTVQHWQEILQVYRPISCVTLDEHGTVKAYAFGFFEGDCAVITEAMGENIAQLVAQIAHNNGKTYGRYLSLPTGERMKPIGMVKPICRSFPQDIAYINLLYN